MKKNKGLTSPMLDKTSISNERNPYMSLMNLFVQIQA
jgi:hypothetical protein